MTKVVIIGSGNVAQHLILAFQNQADLESQIELVQVFARHRESLTPLFDLEKITSDFNEIKPADVYIIAVSDDAISEVSTQLPFENQLVVHTSGSVPLENLNSKNRRGVFYPLQSFSKNKAIDFKTVPLCLEAENETDLELLQKLAQKLSQSVYEINSIQRKTLHVAAVFVNNFVNHLYQIGESICIENQVPFEILKPLIQETAAKINWLSPKEAQTGPAKRNDGQTIEAHKEFLKDQNQNQLYTILTQSIQNNGKKL